MWFFNAMAVGMGLVGAGISIVAWNSGERGLHVFIWPIVFSVPFFIAGLVVRLFNPDLARLASRTPYKFPQPTTVLQEADPVAGDADFGPELFRCRPLPFLKYVDNQGGFFLTLVLLPLVFLPLLAAIGAMMVPAVLTIVYMLSNSAVPLQNTWWWPVVIGVGFVATYGAGIWFVYLAPRGDHLIVHSGGFKLKCYFKNVELLYTDLLEINFGRELEDVRDGTPRDVPPDGLLVLNSAINFHLKSGRTVTVKTFLRRFVQPDTERFLDYIEEHYPALFQERAYLTQSPAGSLFRITESRWKARRHALQPAAQTHGAAAPVVVLTACPQCKGGLKSHADTHFCPYCGSDQLESLTDSMPSHCRACGSYLKVADQAGGGYVGHIQFCMHCGFKLPAQVSDFSGLKSAGHAISPPLNETVSTLYAPDSDESDPDADDSPDASPEEIRRAQLVEQGFNGGMVILFVARWFLPRVLPREYLITVLALPWIGIALVALWGGFFTFTVGRSYKPTRGHASVASLLLVPALILFFHGDDRYPPLAESQVIPFALGGGLLMTLIAAATCAGLWGRWRLLAIIFLKTSVYAAGVALIVNGIFDHADDNPDLVVITSKEITYGQKGAVYHRFWADYLDRPGRRTYISVSGGWYDTKHEGDVICIMHYPGYLRMPRHWTTNCRDADFSRRREALQKYGVDFAMEIYNFNEVNQEDMREWIVARTASDLQSVTGKESRTQIKGRVHAIYRLAGYTFQE